MSEQTTKKDKKTGFATHVSLPMDKIAKFCVARAMAGVKGRNGNPETTCLIGSPGGGKTEITNEIAHLFAEAIGRAGEGRVWKIDLGSNENTDLKGMPAANLEAGDLIVCTGFTTTETMYQMIRRDLPAELLTFPRDLENHIGWYDPKSDLARGSDVLQSEAREIVERGRRLWLIHHASASPERLWTGIIRF